MTHAVHVSAEGVRSPVAAARLEDVVRLVLRAEKTERAMISVALVSDRRSATLNQRHLAHRGPTDVISFGFRPVADGPVIGDIYIAPGVAARNAKAARVGVREEIIRLAVHGTLHVLGYEHPDGDARVTSPMWRRQERLVQRALRRS
jgi:probable rRNA maturation factor